MERELGFCLKMAMTLMKNRAKFGILYWSSFANDCPSVESLKSSEILFFFIIIIFLIIIGIWQIVFLLKKINNGENLQPQFLS